MRRTPPQTPEDEPPVECLTKLCAKFFLLPAACVTFVLGLLFWFLLQLMRIILLPCLGQLFVSIIASKLSAAGGDARAVQKDVVDGAKCGYSLVLWWVEALFFVNIHMIAPLSEFWTW